MARQAGFGGARLGEGQRALGAAQPGRRSVKPQVVKRPHSGSARTGRRGGSVDLRLLGERVRPGGIATSISEMSTPGRGPA